MTRKVTAKAKNPECYCKSIEVVVKADFQHLTSDEVKKRVADLKNKIHDFVRSQGFDAYEIKLS